MLVFANAKINLGLYVTEKRSDGYHNLESLFFPVSLCDVLEAVPAEGNSCNLEISGIPVDGDLSKNLCVKAYNLLKSEFDIPGINAYLLKNIPLGAGLGGGSADAAFMLKLLNELFQLNLNDEQLKSFAAQLGSDCPFFIANRPAFVQGRGEILEDFQSDLQGANLIIVHPGFHISTSEAYAHISPKKAPFNLKELNDLPRQSWRNFIANDFESHMLEIYPAIAEIKNALYDAGAFYASMSGSGSSVYGIFDQEIEIPASLRNYFTAKAKIL